MAIPACFAAGGSAAGEGGPAGTGRERAQVAPSAKLHPALDRLLAERGRVKAWVFFADKALPTPGARAAAIAAVEAGYSPRAIERRRARRTDPGLFDERDVPVPAAYVQAVAASGATMRQTSRWLNAVSVEADRAAFERIAALPFVSSMQPIRWGPAAEPRRPERRASVWTAGRAGSPPHQSGDAFYGRAQAQLTEINLLPVHTAGFTGKDIVVGILDTGFIRTHAAFNQPGRKVQIVAEHDFVKGDPITSPEPGDDPDQAWHGTLILGVLGAYLPNELVGGAYDAKFVLCKTEDITSETPVEEDNYAAGLEFIEANGGDMATASLIYIDWYTQSQLTGLIAVTTKAVNTATANGVFCCNAAGNFGHDEDPFTSALGAPADAFKVITCGAANGDGTIADFSSDGPTADGRVKPEVLARGVDTQTVDPFDDGGYVGVNGTSLSTPLVACAVACMVQARPTYTVDQMRTMLFETAKDYIRTGKTDPLFVRGYGFLDVGTAFASDCNGNGVPDARDISSGSSRDCDGDKKPDECGCRVDFNRDGKLDIGDFTSFQNGFALGTPCTDFNGDGKHDVQDFTAFQNAFAIGCK